MDSISLDARVAQAIPKNEKECRIKFVNPRAQLAARC